MEGPSAFLSQVRVGPCTWGYLSLSFARKLVNSTILLLNALAKHGTPRRASEVTGSHLMLRGAGDLGAKGLAGHPEAYGCCSVAQGQANEVLEGGYGHRFTGWAWVTIYWGLLGHPMGTAAVNAHGLRGNLGHHDKVV